MLHEKKDLEFLLAILQNLTKTVEEFNDRETLDVVLDRMGIVTDTGLSEYFEEPMNELQSVIIKRISELKDDE